MLESMFCRSRKVGSLDFANANSVWALGTFTDFKLNGITVSDLSGDLGDVDEKVVSTFNFNKSESFYLVKPLDSSLRHVPVSMHQVLEEDGWVTGKVAEFRPLRLGRNACLGAFSHEVGEQRRNEGCPEHHVVPKRQLGCFVVDIQPLVRGARFEVM